LSNCLKPLDGPSCIALSIETVRKVGPISGPIETATKAGSIDTKEGPIKTARKAGTKLKPVLTKAKLTPLVKLVL